MKERRLDFPMPKLKPAIFRCLPWICIAAILACLAIPAPGEPTPQASAAFNAYVAVVESRLIQQHRNGSGFLGGALSDADKSARLRRGEIIIERLTPSNASNFPGAMLHDWRGTAFVAGAKAEDFERLMKDFDAYPRTFAPQILNASITSPRKDPGQDRFQASMRIRQHHVITVVMDTAYDIRFERLDPRRGDSISRSTKISEIASPGTGNEHALSPAEEHGFLWNLNSYWSYEERDGGLYMQIESVSLTRSIPAGLGWAVGPFVESIPRESMEFTLKATCVALRK